MPRCKICKTLFKPRFFLQKSCENPTCIIEYGKLLIEKQAKKEWNERKQKLKIEVVRLPKLKAEAKRVAQQYARLRDEKEPCNSCGKKHASQWDGGHYMKAEIYSGVILEEININKQCSYCNKELHGNLIHYREGMIRKYGIETVEILEKKAIETRYKKWSRQELFDKIEYFKSKIKQIKEKNI